MNSITNISLIEHFSILPDPRKTDHGMVRHELLDIIIIAILAVICGADSWVEIAQFGREKETWLKQFLKLENGIPSHDTFGRIFSLLDPEAFERCFSAWVKTVRKKVKGEVVAIDGKSARRSHGNLEKPLHLVNAFAAESGIVLGQRKVDGKTNEITAIPELLDMLYLKGCIVTTDAMGTQGWIVKKIIENKADYVLAVKGNQGRLMEDIVRSFDTPATRHTSDYCKTSKSMHGRDETRECWVAGELDGIRDKKRWDKLQSIAKVTCTRTVNGKTSVESRYFISSLAPDASKILKAVRSHWKVETLHWSLDISFREDESWVRIGHAGENLALVRKLALNLLRNEKTAKGGVKAKRLQAGWSNEYLLTVLGVGSRF
jgi:predicted transposase YbfD/YdcC